MPAPHTDPALVHAAIRGEAHAWDALIAIWLPVVLGWCTRLGGPKVDPEDAAHDVFIVAIEKIHKLRDPDRFPSWLVGVTRRVLASHRRKAWFKRWIPGLEVDAPAPVEGSGSAHVEAALALQNGLEQLSAVHREVVVLVDLEERSLAEAAALLEVPLGTVKSRLTRARAKLTDVLGDGPGPQLQLVEGGHP